MIVQLPVSNDPIQSFTIQLGPIKYILYIQWNDRANVWTMDVTAEASGDVLVTGIPMLLGCDLWQPYLLGNGSMIVWDENGTGADATFTDLGSRVNVYWISPDEVSNAFAT